MNSVHLSNFFPKIIFPFSKIYDHCNHCKRYKENEQCAPLHYPTFITLKIIEEIVLHILLLR